jgi:hypothetical protein
MEDNQLPKVCSKQKLDSETDLKFISEHDCTGIQNDCSQNTKNENMDSQQLDLNNDSDIPF